jgi:hypothetical protein
MPLGLSDAAELTRTIAELIKKGNTQGLQERLTELREAILNAKDEALCLREQNQEMKLRLSLQETWDDRASKFTLVETAGGALAWHSEGPPEHYACPRCFEEQKISVLQDRQASSGHSDCPACGTAFVVKTPRPYHGK